MPQAHIRANEVLDNGSLAFENDDTAPWIADTADFHRGGCSLRSGAIPDDGQTAVSVVLEGSGTLTFWWKVSSNGAPSVTITGLPEGAAVAIRFGEPGIPIPAAAFVGFGDKAEGVFSLALNPEGVVNGVKVQPTIGEGVDNPFVVGEGGVAVTLKDANPPEGAAFYNVSVEK